MSPCQQIWASNTMLFHHIDFGELAIDGIVDTGALTSAIPEADLRKIRLLTPQYIN